MQMLYRIAADSMVIIHFAYVLTVVLGLPITWVGILLGHRWARNFWWRCGHLAMILIVVAEAWAGITCPLTTWEYQLRELAQEKTYQGAFLANLVHDYLFYEAPKWVFTLAYTIFGSLVLASFLYAPPRLPGRKVATAPST